MGIVGLGIFSLGLIVGLCLGVYISKNYQDRIARENYRKYSL